MPEILKIIKSGNPGNVCLTGDCFTVSLDFINYGKNVMKEVNDLLVSYMGTADERKSCYD
jgi:hypothetical protein